MIVEITGLLQNSREKITMTTQQAIDLAKEKLGNGWIHYTCNDCNNKWDETVV